MAIDSFDGKYKFLSNFYPIDVIGFKSVEHAYQATKATDPAEAKAIKEADSPGLAKALGRKCKLVNNWDEAKLNVMDMFLRVKFNNEEMKKLLLETGNEELVEGNTWGDTYWGVCKGKGKNNLGKLLMKIRADLRK